MILPPRVILEHLPPSLRKRFLRLPLRSSTPTRPTCWIIERKYSFEYYYKWVLLLGHLKYILGILSQTTSFVKYWTPSNIIIHELFEANKERNSDLHLFLPNGKPHLFFSHILQFPLSRKGRRILILTTNKQRFFSSVSQCPSSS